MAGPYPPLHSPRYHGRMTSDAPREPRPVRHRAIRLAWLVVPVSVLAGDSEIRWIREFGRVVEAFPGWFASSVLVSLVAWGSWVALLAGLRARWVTLPALAFAGATAVAVTWGSMLERYFAVTPQEVLFLLEEPVNALSFLRDGLSWTTLPLWLGLATVWSAALLAAAHRPVPPQARFAGAVGLIFATVYLSILPSMFAMPWTPYPSDVRSVYVAQRGLASWLRGTRSMQIGSPERVEVPSAPPRDGPSVLFVVGESMRLDHMSAFSDYERETTPRLDAFVAKHRDRTWSFRRHVPNSSATFWAIAGLLTGQYPIHGRDAARRAPTLWQYADAAGYHTFLATAQSWSWAGMHAFWLDPKPDWFADADTLGIEVTNDTGGDDVAAAAAVAEHLADVEGPFLGIVQLNATHWPFEGPREEVGWPIEDQIDRFDAATARSDHALGLLLDALEKSGRLDETIVVFTSDHAEILSGQFTQEERRRIAREEPGLLHGARVASCEPIFANAPLLLYLPPTVNADATVLTQNTSRVTSHTDIFATILQALEQQPVAPRDGQSLLEPIAEDRQAYCFTGPAWSINELSGVGVREGDEYRYARTNLGRVHRWNLGAPGASDRRGLGEELDEDVLRDEVQNEAVKELLERMEAARR